MTLTATPTIHLSTTTVLTNQTTEPVDCYWCSKMLNFTDGQRSLEELATQLHLPVKVAFRLALRGLERGWFGVAEGGSKPLSFWAELHQRLDRVLGSQGSRLLEQATQMTRLSPEQLTVQDYSNLLIAIELIADDQSRLLLLPHLDELRQQYAA